MSVSSDLRDEVYTRIALKKSLSQFTFNNFTVQQTHAPYQELVRMTADHPGGKVYVVAGVPGPLVNTSRTNTGLLREYAVMIGYQKANIDFDDLTANDTLLDFIEELEEMCRTEITPTLFSFVRLEPLQDENQVPYDLFTLRNVKMFEAYFTAFFNYVVQ